MNVDLRISKIIKFQDRYDLQHFQDPPKILDSVVSNRSIIALKWKMVPINENHWLSSQIKILLKLPLHYFYCIVNFISILSKQHKKHSTYMALGGTYILYIHIICIQFVFVADWLSNFDLIEYLTINKDSFTESLFNAFSFQIV